MHKVSCGTIPIVDYSNILILGITTALAWELPDEPFYPDSELMEDYQEGRLPLLERSDNFTDATSSKQKKKSKPTKPISQPAPIAFNINDLEYFNQPSFDHSSHPINPHIYSQPHPYYTNYNELDKYSPLDTYYYGNGPVTAGRPGAVPLNSNKLKYYLSLADEFLKQFNAQPSNGTTKKPTDTLKKRIDVKYVVLTPLYFIHFPNFFYFLSFSFSFSFNFLHHSFFLFLFFLLLYYFFFFFCVCFSPFFLLSFCYFQPHPRHLHHS